MISDVAKLVEAFHTVHDRVYAVRDEASEIECVNWRGTIAIGLGAKAAAKWQAQRRTQAEGGCYAFGLFRAGQGKPNTGFPRP